MPWNSSAQQELGKARRVDVPARHENADPLASHIDSALEDRRRCQASRRFHDKLHAAGKKAHRFHQLRVADRNDVVHQLADHSERVMSQMLSLGTVRYRLRDINVDNGAGAEAAFPVIARFGLDADNQALWSDRAGRDGGARKQPAPAQWHDERIQRTRILKQFFGCGALARHHVRMVVGRNQGEDTFLREAAYEGLPILGKAVVKDHFASVAASGGNLDAWRVARHHDDRVDSLEPRRERNGLRMVA